MAGVAGLVAPGVEQHLPHSTDGVRCGEVGVSTARTSRCTRGGGLQFSG